jgi:hypothetical protein
MLQTKMASPNAVLRPPALRSRTSMKAAYAADAKERGKRNRSITLPSGIRFVGERGVVVGAQTGLNPPFLRVFAFSGLPANSDDMSPTKPCMLRRVESLSI